MTPSVFLTEVLEVSREEEEELLEEASRKLICREEELFSQDSPSEEDEDQLQRDLEALLLHVWMAVNNTFSAASSSSSRDLKVLQSAVASILQQEALDRHWADRPDSHVPVWRPHKCLRTHTTMLHHMVQSRLNADEDETGGGQRLSSPLKREVGTEFLTNNTEQKVAQSFSRDTSHPETQNIDCTLRSIS